jgi:hypothetical protein
MVISLEELRPEKDCAGEPRSNCKLQTTFSPERASHTEKNCKCHDKFQEEKEKLVEGPR